MLLVLFNDLETVVTTFTYGHFNQVVSNVSYNLQVGPGEK